jgi:hypothetical protein
MIDSEFDDFAKGKLGDHEVPVPAGLWDKVADQQFDQFVGNTFKDSTAPVPAGLWDKITDGQFDSFVGSSLADYEAPVPAGMWDKISDRQLDNFVSDKLTDYVSPVPAGLWDRINDGQFDSFVHDKLADTTAPVPAGLWEKIMPPEEKDRGGYVWFRNAGRAAAVLLLMALLGGGYFWYRNQQQPAGNGSKDSAATTGLSNGKDALNTSPSTSTKEQQQTAPDGTTPGEQPSGENNSTTVPSVKQDADNTRSNAAGNLLNNKPSADLKSDLGNTGNAASARTDKQDNSITETNRDRKVSRDRSDLSVPPANNANPAANAGADRNNRNNAGLVSQPVDESKFDFIEPYEQNHLQRGNTIPTDLTRTGGYISMLDKQATAKHYSNFKSVIICPADKNRNTDWFLEAYASPDIAFRSLTNNTASQTYLLRKDSSESMRVGYTAGIRLVKPINDNILVKAGVQYTQMNQKYVYRTENEVKTITVVSTRTIIRAPGDTVIVRDTSVLQQIGFKNNTVINRFRTIDVPVMVGYQFGNEDLKIGINAGVVFNLSSSYQGVQLDSSLATVPITKGSSNMVYKSNIGMGLVGSVSLVKKLSDDLHIFAEPYFRYNLSNMTTPNAPYNQKFSLGGIAVGVRLNLNRQ